MKIMEALLRRADMVGSVGAVGGESRTMEQALNRIRRTASEEVRWKMTHDGC